MSEARGRAQRKRRTVDDLVRRATAGRSLDRRVVFRPSIAYALLNDPFCVWCDYHAPEREAVDETTRFERLRMSWGSDHEDRWVAENHPDAVRIEPRWGIDALRATARAMLDGAPAIHQAQLWDLETGIYGIGDLLVRRDDARSDLGPFHYEVVEVKRFREVKPYHLVQVGAYNRVLARLQGKGPAHVQVVLADGVERLPASDAEGEFDEAFSLWSDIRDGRVKPDLPGMDEASSPWRVYANKLLTKRQDPTLCPAISGSARDKLARKLGVKRVEDLDGLDQEDFQEALGPIAGLRTWYRVLAHRTGRPVLAEGEEVSIPRGRRGLYFDFETSGGEHPSIPAHAYMIGVYDLDRGKYVPFVARGPEEEARMTQEFLDYVGSPRSAWLYHWTGYELGVLDDIADRHPSLASRVRRVKRSCVDLKRCVDKKLWFGTRTYSIKEVGPFLGFRWRQEDVDGMESMVLYWEWLGGRKEAIEKVLRYNEDDCVAMAHVHRAIDPDGCRSGARERAVE